MSGDPAVLVVSYTGRATGFGRVAAGIAGALRTGHEVHVVGLGPAAPGEPWIGHPHDDRYDATRAYAAAALTGTLCPVCVILLGDASTIAWTVTLVRRGGYAGTVLTYVPVEGEIGDAGRLAGLRAASQVIAYTRAGAAELRAALRSGGEDPPDVVVIPHAIDPAPAVPSPDRAAMRAAILPDVPAGGTWILDANRNDPRKRPELAVQAFARVAGRHPGATLILHCAPARPGLDLRIERDRLGLRGRIVLTREDGAPWPDERLAGLYASCEIGVSTATGEGWGLVAFEHALHGGAQILPRHAALAETWGDAPAWVPVGRSLPSSDACVGRLPDVGALAATLDALLARPDRRRDIADACRARAADPALSWPVVGERWRAIVASSRARTSRPRTSCPGTTAE